MKTNFYLKTDKKYTVNGKDTNAERPINFFFSFDGMRGKYATGLSVAPSDWNDAKDVQRVRGNKNRPDYELVNRILDTLETDAKRIEKEFKDKKTDITERDIVNELKRINNKGDKEIKTDFFGVYEMFKEAKKRAGLGKKTIQKIETLKKKLQKFERDTNTVLTFDGMNSDMYDKITEWYFNNETKNPTLYKEIALLKTFLHWSLLKEYNQSSKFIKAFKVIEEKKEEIIALTEEELEAVENYEPTDPNLQRIKDVFLFSCYTALRHSDIYNLQPGNIINGKTLNYVSIKTGNYHQIDMVDKAIAILNKYKNNLHLKSLNQKEGTNRVLPVINDYWSNIYLQDLLKEIGGSFLTPRIKVEFSGKKRIDTNVTRGELITFHAGRRTFITISLYRGVSVITTMQNSNHSDFKSFEKYIAHNKEARKEETHKAWNKPTQLKKVG